MRTLFRTSKTPQALVQLSDTGRLRITLPTHDREAGWQTIGQTDRDRAHKFLVANGYERLTADEARARFKEQCKPKIFFT